MIFQKYCNKVAPSIFNASLHQELNLESIINRMQAEAANLNAQQPAQQPKKSTLVLASLRHHSPEEIYDYITRHIGDIGIKIKKKQAVIGFENQQHFDRLMEEHRVINLHGKRIEFKPIMKGDENTIGSEEQEIVQPVKTNYGLADFTCANQVEAKINSSRYSMVEKVIKLFQPTIEATRKRMEQMRLQFREDGLRKREMLSLDNLVSKKLHDVESRYVHDIEKLQRQIQQFYVKPTNIDLEPSFTFEETWQFPKMTLNNMRFQPANFFSNKNNYACKRLCAINGNEFAVTMGHRNGKGYTKIYDVNISDPKKMIPFDTCAYAINRINNYLLIGLLQTNTIKYLNLQDEQLQIESSQQLGEMGYFFQIKTSKKSVDNPQILTLCTDKFLRSFQLNFIEALPGIMTVCFSEKFSFKVEDCIAMEVLNENEFLYGTSNKLRLYNVTKKKFDEIEVSDIPSKIRRFSQNLICITTKRNAEMVDLRTNTVVQTFPRMNDLKTFDILGEHTLVYGAKEQIGLLDDRRNEVVLWKSDDLHKGLVYDVLKLKDKVVSCDSAGQIYSWEIPILGAPISQTFNPTPAPSTVQIEFGKN